jgi:hypothetical protein
MNRAFSKSSATGTVEILLLYLSLPYLMSPIYSYCNIIQYMFIQLWYDKMHVSSKLFSFLLPKDFSLRDINGANIIPKISFFSHDGMLVPI